MLHVWDHDLPPSVWSESAEHNSVCMRSVMRQAGYDWHCNPAWTRMTSSCSAHHALARMFHRHLWHALIPGPPSLAARACMRPHCVLKYSMQSILLQVIGQQRSDHAHCALQAPGPAATATSASWTSTASRASSSTALSSCASTWPTSACSSSSTSTSSRASRSAAATSYSDHLELKARLGCNTAAV